MSVHYKFKSSVAYDTVTFDGLHISVGDLKKAILQQKKIGKSADFDLQITNAQTKEVFSADDDLVPKNTSVIVARVPVSNPVKKSWERSDANTLMQGNDSPSHVQFDKLAKTADLVNANATEDEKIKAMMTQSAHEYDPSKYVKSRSMTGPLPANYVCYRCGKSGHWIKNCPTNNVEVKRSTGIPRSFMVTVDGPDHKGALLTSSGDFAVPLIDQQAYKVVKKEKPPFLKEAEVPPDPEPQIPEDLLCMICKDLLQDAVLIPCCGNCYCDECVRQALLDSENHECPTCHETGISPDTLIPNRFQRNAVRNFKNETGYIRSRKGMSDASYPTTSALPVPVASVPAAAATAVATKSSSPRPESADNFAASANPPQEKPVLDQPESLMPHLVVDSEGLKHAAPESVPAVESGAPDLKQEDKVLETSSDEKGVTPDQDVRAATPLADEPPTDFKGHYEEENQHVHHSSTRDTYDRPSHSHYGYSSPPSESEPSTISTITTRTLTWVPGRKPYWNKYPNHHYEPPSHRDARDGRDYGSSYRSSSSDYHHRAYSSHRNYPMSSNYRYPPRGSSRGSRNYSRYGSPPHSVSRYVSPPPGVPGHRSSHVMPAAVVHQPPPASVRHQEPAPYHTEPPPPGTDSHNHPPQRPDLPSHHEPLPSHQEPPPMHRDASAHNHEPLLQEPGGHHEPPPPGVGPLVPLPPPASGVSNHPVPAPHVPTSIPSATASLGPTYTDNYSRHLDVYRQSNLYHNSRRAKDKKWSKDPMDDFARELLEFKRERRPHSSRRSRSRSYHSSKSWSHSRSRSYSPSLSRSRSRSRSHTYSSRSRSRSFSRTRSRSRSPARSFSRSRSHSRGSIHSGSRSPRRKYRSPHRYFRSRSRSPAKHFRGSAKPYPKRPEMHSPSYYNQTSFAPNYSQSMPQNPAPVEQYGSDRYYDAYHMGYDNYLPHNDRRYNLSIPPQDGRYPPHVDKFVDTRKYHGRVHDRRVVLRKDERMGRVEIPGSYGAEKYKERMVEMPTYPVRKEEKVKEESRHYHHKYRDSSKKSTELPKKNKEVKIKSEANTETVQVTITKETKPKRSSKTEKHGKEHKHKHKKGKDGEEHKKKKKKQSSDDTSQVTGSESDKPKKKSKKKKIIEKMKQISEEVPESSENVDVMNRPDTSPGNKSNLDNTEETLATGLECDVLNNEKQDMESPEADYAEDMPTPEAQERPEKTGFETEDDLNAGVEKEEIISESDQAVLHDYTEVKDEASIQNESFSGEEAVLGSAEESDAVEDSLNDSVLKVHLPEISKWERDDSEEPESEEEPSSPASKKGDGEEGAKMPLTSDIIQKAENAILQKAPKLQSVGENPATRSKPAGHPEKTTESKTLEPVEPKTEESVEKPVKSEKRETISKSSDTESPRKREDVHTSNTVLRRETERRDQVRRDRIVTETRILRTASRDWERDRPGSRNSSGSLHSSGSRHRSGSRNRSVHTRTHERHVRDTRREVGFREGPRPGIGRNISEGSKKRDTDSDASNSLGTKSLRQRKTSRDHHHDESNFEPNYDETSDSEGSTMSNRERPKIVKRRVSIKNEPLPAKHSRSGKSSHSEPSRNKNLETEKTHSRSTSDQRNVISSKVTHRSSEDSGSPAESVARKRTRDEASSTTREIQKRSKEKSESVSSSSSCSDSDADENPKKKSRKESSEVDEKHRQRRAKHKKHKKHKHKHKKKKSNRKEREEVRVMSSIVRR